MRRGGWPPAVAAPWSFLSSAIRAASVVMFRPKRITPPTSPRRMRPSRSALGTVVPSIATMSFWPTSWASVGPAGVGVGVGFGVGLAVGTAVGVALGVDVGPLVTPTEPVVLPGFEAPAVGVGAGIVG